MSKLRTFNVRFTTSQEEGVNDMMRHLGIWQEGEGAAVGGIVTTTNELPFEEYRELLAKGFESEGGKLYHIEEVIS